MKVNASSGDTELFAFEIKIISLFRRKRKTKREKNSANKEEQTTTKKSNKKAPHSENYYNAYDFSFSFFCSVFINLENVKFKVFVLFKGIRS